MPRPSKGEKVSTQKNQEQVKELNIHNIFVFHIGSLNLYYGKASDLTPNKINFVIARKKNPDFSNSNNNTNDITNIRTTSFDHSLASKSIQESLKLISSLKNSFKAQQIYFNVNDKAKIETNQIEDKVLSFDNNNDEMAAKKFKSSSFVGEEVFKLSEKEYFINWPVYGSDFNYKMYNDSMESLLCDIEDIFRYVLVKKLSYDEKISQVYRVVILVPDHVNKLYVRNLTHVLIDRLSIKNLMILQESVCSSYGFGLPTSCIVDVGHIKTSVSCVEDGLSISNSKIRLMQGGLNISTSLYWLMHENGAFNEKIDTLNDSELFHFIENVKIKNCHLKLNQSNEDCSWTSECFKCSDDFNDKNNSLSMMNPSIKVPNALILPPLCFFNPGLCGIKNGSLITAYECFDAAVVEDLMDDKFILDLQFRDTNQKKTKDGQEVNVDANSISQNDSVAISNNENTLIASEYCSNAINILNSLSSENIENNNNNNNNNFLDNFNAVSYGLESIIVSSIESCPIADTRKKLYESIMVVGGGLSFVGADKVLQNRIKNKLPVRSKNISDSIEVCMRPKDLETNCVTWKGGSVISMLDSAQDLWINNREWSKYGMRIIREKGLYQFTNSFDK